MITHGVILSGSQTGEARELIEGLGNRGLLGWQVYVVLRAGEAHTIIFDIPEGQLGKLPADDQGPYLGDDVSGHAFAEVDDHLLRQLVEQGDEAYIIQGPEGGTTQ